MLSSWSMVSLSGRALSAGVARVSCEGCRFVEHGRFSRLPNGGNAQSPPSLPNGYLSHAAVVAKFRFRVRARCEDGGWGAEDGACDRVSRKGRLPCIARGGASECRAVVEAKARRPGFRLTSGALPFGGRVPPSGEKCGIIGANEPKGAARRGHAMREAAPLASERTAHGT